MSTMEWISIKDRLPEDRVKILVYNGDCCSVSSYLAEYYPKYGFHQWSHNGEMYEYSSVTHWMSLPAPPKE